MITRRKFLRNVASGALLAGSSALSFSGCAGSLNDNQVIIYSCGEGSRNELLMTELRRDLPEYDIRMHYMSTGNLAARLRVEGEKAECDIALMLEAGYLLASEEALSPLDERYDLGVFESDLQISNRIMPFTRECGCLAYNRDILERDGIRPPESYDDLLDSRFAGRICIPNPKSSSTGYNFFYRMVLERGEEGAFEYFDALSKNVYQFSSSGGTPVTALTQGEASVGFALLFELVAERNEGSPIELCVFPEGVPWTMNGLSVVRGRERRAAVMDVVTWFYNKGILLDKQNFVPDSVFVDQHTDVEGYPRDLAYADMDGLFDLETKERLLSRWNY